jgi:hypothetical protein
LRCRRARASRSSLLLSVFYPRSQACVCVCGGGGHLLVLGWSRRRSPPRTRPGHRILPARAEGTWSSSEAAMGTQKKRRRGGVCVWSSS